MESQERKYYVCIRKKIHIKGLVQGVGFRPFVYRLAHQLKISGNVENSNDGVHILAIAPENVMQLFLYLLRTEAPQASHIDEIIVSDEAFDFNDNSFEIISSRNISDEITGISPDIAVCSDCLTDMKTQTHRLNYPFINCTNCGPRFTIIEDLPYDREKTSMKVFAMCDKCSGEYTDVGDRRFHAQPVACSQCGPEYELMLDGESVKDINFILSKCSSMISDGKIIAMKGLGGFHLACDAMNSNAVKRMRELKTREAKPFAVMFSSLERINENCIADEHQKQLIVSWKRPVVLLKQKPGSSVCGEVSAGLDTLGVMLPYMPFHHLLFEHLKTDAIVLTSGNISDEPIVIDNEEASAKLGPLSDALLIYNREIYNRTDDSVVFSANNRERIIRRSRGYVPDMIGLEFNADGIFAAGAELKNCFCYGKGKSAVMSQHIGDLKNLETFAFYKETAEKFKKLLRVNPAYYACDMHPDYMSTGYATGKGGEGIISVQHHHAHVASCMAENGLDEKVIGVSLDGTGYGDDGNTWGSEFLICDFEGYDRVTHFDYIPLPGGDKAADEPWRMAVSYLYRVYGNELLALDIPLLKAVPLDRIKLLMHAIDKKMNCPLTSGAGRLFDAVAAISGICYTNRFEAEAPMLLEAIADHSVNTAYPFEVKETLHFDQTIREIVNDVTELKGKSVIAARFQNTLIAAVLEIVKMIRKKSGLNKVVLSGGVFQNLYLLENTENRLKECEFEVFSHTRVPSNDGGLALGQLAIAARRLKGFK